MKVNTNSLDRVGDEILRIFFRTVSESKLFATKTSLYEVIEQFEKIATQFSTVFRDILQIRRFCDATGISSGRLKQSFLDALKNAFAFSSVVYTSTPDDIMNFHTHGTPEQIRIVRTSNSSIYIANASVSVSVSKPVDKQNYEVKTVWKSPVFGQVTGGLEILNRLKKTVHQYTVTLDYQIPQYPFITVRNNNTFVELVGALEIVPTDINNTKQHIFVLSVERNSVVLGQIKVSMAKLKEMHNNKLSPITKQIQITNNEFISVAMKELAIYETLYQGFANDSEQNCELL